MAASRPSLRAFYLKDDCESQYRLGDVLGTGSFATVRKATCKKDGGEWAVKIIDKTKLEKEDEASLKVEVAILERVDHPHIVQLRQVFDGSRKFHMVMELMTGGELFDRIVAKEKYGEAEAASTIRDIAGALAYCHERGIVHRDLKPENLLYKDTTDSSLIKIADFGLAKLVNASEMMATACGTPGYVAPEVLEGKGYGEKVDCWSVGVIAYIMLCGFPPFYDENNATLFAQIKAASYDFPSPYWDDVSESAKDLVRKLLVVDPAKRLSAADVLKHPWVASGGAGGTGKALNIGEQLRKYTARRKFREGVRKVQALRMFAKLGLAVSAGAAAAAAAGEGGSSGAAPGAATGGAGTAAVAAPAPAAAAAATPAAAPAAVTAAAAAPAAAAAAAGTGDDGDLLVAAMSAISRVRLAGTSAPPVPIPPGSGTVSPASSPGGRR